MAPHQILIEQKLHGLSYSLRTLAAGNAQRRRIPAIRTHFLRRSPAIDRTHLSTVMALFVHRGAA